MRVRVILDFFIPEFFEVSFADLTNKLAELGEKYKGYSDLEFRFEICFSEINRVELYGFCEETDIDALRCLVMGLSQYYEPH